MDQHLRLCRSDQILCLPQQDQLQDTSLASLSQSPTGKLGGGRVPLRQALNLISRHPKPCLPLRTSRGSSRRAETPGSTISLILLLTCSSPLLLVGCCAGGEEKPGPAPA